MPKFLLVMTAVLGCLQLGWPGSPVHAEEQSVRLHVKRMMCESCAREVKDRLTQVEGIRSVEIDSRKDEVRVEYQSERTNPEEMIRAIRSLGYSATRD